MHILIVGESTLISESIRKALETYGYFAECTKIKDFEKKIYMLSSVDVLVTDIDKSVNISKIKSLNPKICIIGITSERDWDQKIQFLKEGADDVLNYPFPLQELIVRIQHALNKPQNVAGNTLKISDLELNPEEKTVIKDKKEIALRKKEFCLLEYLLRNKERTISRNELLDHVWDYRKINNSNTIDVHIKRLRDKIQEKDLIQTIHGFGYKVSEKNKLLHKEIKEIPTL